MSLGAPTKWQRNIIYDRSVMCPGGCGYMAHESWRAKEVTGTGVCTNCGHCWQIEGQHPAVPKPMMTPTEADR